MHRPQTICPRLARLTMAGFLAVFALRPTLAETDIRRDAIVKVVEEVMPCVVNVATESIVQSRDPFDELWRHFYGYPSRPQVRSALGSGVIISDDGYLLTNLHVVKRANRIQVQLSDAAGGGVYDVTPVYGSTKTDVALLKIVPKKKGEKFHAVKFARDDDLLLGETVVALGNPFGLGESVSRGILSSKRRSAPKENEDLRMENWLQTDALINPGNSGGPLVDLRGELIGINVAILQGAQGIGFAIPVKELRQALSDIFNPETASRWFGAHVSVAAPLRVEKIDPHSPASKAGLKVGDAIVAVNNQPAYDYIQFNRTLRESPSLNFDLSVQREGEVKEIKVRLMPFPELFRQRMGLDLQELTTELVGQLGLGSVEAGLLISRVEKGSTAENAGLREYDVVTAIGGQPARNYLDAFLAVTQIKPGESADVSVLVPRTRGNVILGYQEGTTELKLR
ncbi:MAG: trypsin-like peptidase domain-containing protein [Limisphaerales bacterium]